jgi:HlyD family secretion protein
MRRPRFRFTIRCLMIAIVLASLVLALFVVQRNRRRRLLALQSAQVNYEAANAARYVAELVMKQYTQGIYVYDLAAVKTEIAVADSDFRRAQDQLAWSQSMLETGLVPLALLGTDEEALQRSKLALERAQKKLATMEVFTKPKMIKELQSEVDKAKSDELARKIEYDQLKAAVARKWW